jgi:hypothetical protein
MARWRWKLHANLREALTTGRSSRGKELKLDASLHTLLQILSVTLFEKMLLQQAPAELTSGSPDLGSPNQLNLFDS